MVGSSVSFLLIQRLFLVCSAGIGSARAPAPDGRGPGGLRKGLGRPRRFQSYRRSAPDDPSGHHRCRSVHFAHQRPRQAKRRSEPLRRNY